MLTTSLTEIAAKALTAQREIDRLTSTVIDPAKERFREETLKAGKGFTTEVEGIGKVATASGASPKTTTSLKFNSDKLTEKELNLLIKRGVVERVTTTSSGSAPRVTFTLNV